MNVANSLQYKMMTPIAFFNNLKLYKKILMEKFK